MTVSSAITNGVASAVSILEAPETKAIVSAALSAGGVTGGVSTAVAVGMASIGPMYRLFQLFSDGQISADKLKADWDAQLATGAIADAAVDHAEALRDAAQPQS